MAKGCPHCQMAPCIGGKGPGSCMSGSKGKTVPTPRSGREQEVEKALKTHTSDWRRVGSIERNGKTFTSWTCGSCGDMTVAEGKNAPSNEVHKDRKLWLARKRERSMSTDVWTAGMRTVSCTSYRRTPPSVALSAVGGSSTSGRRNDEEVPGMR